MRLIGYARVSTREQETRMQLDALAAAGVGTIYEEKASSIGQRYELQRCLKSLTRGDVLVVYKLDRVARSLVDLLSILDRIKLAGAEVRSLNEPLDTTSPMGVFMLQVLGAVAQLERGIIRERVIAGQVAAISRGQRHGRPRTLTMEQEAEVRRLVLLGATQAEIARQLQVSRAVVDRVMNPWRTRYAPQRPVLGPLLNAPTK
ncbi:recombinase family protein [Acidovorax sp. SUPP2825]|uniref:recombinase family protein n=1 Tax=Acidovorax sp. SUPP2825 TaxID=2920879 RepID=UPI0023DE2803|nr:recombinase family protein [Acidovorax sp. SUPP2825]GKS96156.1 recombinase family protein [Acidovorax sp. SUPP2825]